MTTYSNDSNYSNRTNQQWQTTFSPFESITNLVRRQPGLVLAGSLIGGALLAFLMQKSNSGQRNFASSTYRPQCQRENQRATPLPSAHMGATEGQMEAKSEFPATGVQSGDAGTTGVIYELDQASITPG